MRIIHQRCVPIFGLSAKKSGVDAAEHGRTVIDASQCFGEQCESAGPVVALQMMKGCGKLDQRAQKASFRLREREPDDLPVFMCVPELLGAVAAQAFGEGAGVPVEGRMLRFGHDADGVLQP